MPVDRRAVLGGLSGLGGLALAGCSGASGGDAPQTPAELDLADVEAGIGGRIGLMARVGSVEDDGRALGWRSDERFLYCSTFKMFLAAATMMRAQAGQEQLYRAVTIEADDILAHSPVTENFAGQTQTVEQLCQATVEVSDNAAANILIRELGGLEALQAWYRSIGDTVTRVDRWELDLNTPDGDQDTTSPAAAAANVQRLLASPVEAREGVLLSPENRGLLELWMVASPTGPNRMRAGIPVGWSAAHKTGTSGTIHANDIGLVRTSSGDAMTLAIYCEGGPDSTPESRDAAIAEATRRAIETLTG